MEKFLEYFVVKVNHNISPCLFRTFHMHDLPTQDDNIYCEGKKIFNLSSYVD